MKTPILNIFFKFFLASFLLVCSDHLLFAQAGVDPAPPPILPNTAAAPNSAPIDGGILGLLVAGMALGAKHFLNKNKE